MSPMNAHILHQGPRCAIQSTGFSRCVELGVHLHCITQNCSPPSEHPSASSTWWRQQPRPPETIGHFYSCSTSAFLECQRNKIIQSLGSLFRLALPLSDMHLERYPVFMCNVITRLCYSRVLVHRECTRMCSPIHLLKDRWAGFLHSFVIMNKAARNICMFLCFQTMWMNIQACNWCPSRHLCVQLWGKRQIFPKRSPNFAFPPATNQLALASILWRYHSWF